MKSNPPANVTAAFEPLLEEIEEEIELVNRAGAKAFGDGHEGQGLRRLVGERCDCLVAAADARSCGVAQCGRGRFDYALPGLAGTGLCRGPSAKVVVNAA
jgi:hypothetical protein